MHATTPGFFKTFGTRARAAGLHLLASGSIAAVVAVLVFGYWYPGDLRLVAGGTALFTLVMVVDVVMGPMLTFVVFDRSKGVSHLRRDIAVIALLQMLALSYGLHTMYMGRPVGLAFEFDRFRVVSMAEVVVAELDQAPPMFRRLPLDGPMLFAVRKSSTTEERADALNASIFQGVDNGQRPKFWIPYDEQARAQAAAAGRPLDALISKYPSSKAAVDRIRTAMATQDDRDGLRFLPVRAKHDAVVVLTHNGGIVEFLLYDGFF
ncbi:TfpX/TfpZ family type IV pilin accessory protein [Hydrogenophaga sp. SL48]|uniref:TfpX/TfpZ family type IV pilin accessory protein n=1 Tax=Hydrogenophaga sp. SL48 TaxID=2806347 RepID=UPI001F2C646E|nr:TfpX/TfpZ family type IV pilin accessory protein [Hydrogenophaga sp. SL48]UJW80183.1 pilus assembly protein [Hydrogenophaga sp. SL48]